MPSVDAVDADSKLLDELHLSSITVGQIVNDAVRALGLAQPAAGLPAATRFDALYAADGLDLVVTPAAYGNLAAVGLPQSGNARAVGAAALEAAESLEERQLAHVCLARIHFQDRREREELEAFEEHCRAAVRLGHAGTFCYERLATLYEYRGQLDEAERVCRLAVEALREEDPRSIGKFEKRLRRLEEG